MLLKQSDTLFQLACYRCGRITTHSFTSILNGIMEQQNTPLRGVYTKDADLWPNKIQINYVWLRKHASRLGQKEQQNQREGNAKSSQLPSSAVSPHTKGQREARKRAHLEHCANINQTICNQILFSFFYVLKVWLGNFDFFQLFLALCKHKWIMSIHFQSYHHTFNGSNILQKRM